MIRPADERDANEASFEVELAVGSTALTIAGSDPSGGAGLQADLKAFQQVGVYGMSVVTLLTVQNTQGVRDVRVMEEDLVLRQLDAVLEDITPLVIKTGALGEANLIQAIAGRLRGFSGELVVDPVLVSKHGHSLASAAAVDAYREFLFPIATLVTPNRFEASAFLGRELESAGEDDFAEAAEQLRGMGPAFTLLKAGKVGADRLHFLANKEQVTSIACEDHATHHTHGAGCSLSATIAARLAITDPTQPLDERMHSAVQFAISAVSQAISIAPGLGNGSGPIESRILHLGTG
ncbi:MAG: bifunctional hydroxymethylpyrimidine kinase/phosphomethylpyrimidine kinase [Planctomycetota bacterium]